MKKIIAVSILILIFSILSITVTIYNHFFNVKVEYVLKDKYESKINTFSLHNIDGEHYVVDSQSGKPKMINFWASWCPYCNKEAPHLNALYDTYKDKVEFISINVTTSDSLSGARTYIDKYQFKFPTLLDETGDVSSSFLISAIPTNYFVRGDGTIHSITHEVTESNAKKIFEEMLKE